MEARAEDRDDATDVRVRDDWRFSVGAAAARAGSAEEEEEDDEEEDEEGTDKDDCCCCCCCAEATNREAAKPADDKSASTPLTACAELLLPAARGLTPETRIELSRLQSPPASLGDQGIVRPRVLRWASSSSGGGVDSSEKGAGVPPGEDESQSESDDRARGREDEADDAPPLPGEEEEEEEVVRPKKDIRPSSPKPKLLDCLNFGIDGSFRVCMLRD